MILSKKSFYFILFSVLFYNSISMAVYTYLSRYLLFLGANYFAIQMIVTIFPLTSVIFPPILGKISDSIQKRLPFVLIGQIGIVLVLYLLTLTKDLIIISVIIFIWGFFSSCLGLNSVLYAEIVENDQKLISYYSAMVSFGWFLGALYSGIFVEMIGIAYLFYLLLFFSLFNLILIFFIQEPRDLILSRYENGLSGALQFIATSKNSDSEDIESPISQSIYFSLFFRNFGIRPILSVLAIIMAFHLSSDTEIGILVGINPLIQFFIMISIGNIINKKNIKAFMIIGYILNCFVIIGYIISNSFFSFLIFQILISLAFSLFWVPTQVYIAQNTTPENKGKYMSFANTSFFLGSLMGGLFFSGLISIYQDYYIAMYFMIIFPLLSTLIILFFFRIKFEEK
ncbi:MAG: MFS transporter [Promethearchaeota archaeon]